MATKPAEKQYTDDGIEITTFTDAEKAKAAEEMAARQAADAPAEDAPTV